MSKKTKSVKQPDRSGGKKAAFPGKIPGGETGPGRQPAGTYAPAAALAAPDTGHTLIFWGLMALLFLPPFFRGLFFAPEQEKALLFAAVLFWAAWLWKWARREHGFLSSPLDWFILAFPAVYLASAFQAANYGMAIDEVVKTTLYFLTFWLVSRLIRDEIKAATLLRVVYAAAVGVALAGLATATGDIHINDGFLNGRIYSTFQYPNALASFLGAAMFFGIYNWLRSFPREWAAAGAAAQASGHIDVKGRLTDPDKTGAGGNAPKGGRRPGPAANYGLPPWLNLDFIYRYLFSAGNFTVLAVLLGTKSQAGLAVFAAVFALFLAGLPRGRRVPVVIHAAMVAAPAFLAMKSFLAEVAAQRPDWAWLWIFTGLAAVLAFQALYDLAAKKGLLNWIASHRKVVLAVLLLLVVAGGIGLGIYVNSHAGAVKAVVEELRLRNATERFYFYNDAMKMIRERPLLGWGGGGWEEAYRSFQGYLYNSNQVHGYFMQVLVEAGIPGLLAVLGIFIFFFRSAHRLYRGAKRLPERRTLIWTITVAVTAIALHAAIDFDLSLSALTLVLFSMFGLARGFELAGAPAPAVPVKTSGRRKVHEQLNYSLLAAFSAASLVLIVFAGMLSAANSSARQAGGYIQAQDYSHAATALQKATSYNPYNADFHSDLSVVYQRQSRFEEALAESQQAAELSKYNSQRYAGLADAMYSLKRYDEVAGYSEKALALAPFQVQWYEFLSRTYFTIGYTSLVDEKKEEAKQYLVKATGVPGRIDEKMATIGETEKKLWNVAPLMTATPGVKLNAGACRYLLGQFSEAGADLQAAYGSATKDDSRTKGEAALWLAILRDKQGRGEESQAYLAEAQKLVPSVAKGFEGLRKLPVF
ncbi:MAG: O-antigen ligase family protein [Eubacteriales bacterium]